MFSTGVALLISVRDLHDFTNWISVRDPQRHADLSKIFAQTY